MKARFPVLLPAAFALAFAFTLSPLSASAPWQNRPFPGQRFLVSTPPGWESFPSNSQFSVLHLVSPEALDFDITVVPAPQLADATTQEMVVQMDRKSREELVAPIRGQFPTAKVSDRGKIVIGNYDWYKVVITGTLQTPGANVEMTMWIVSTLFEGKIYTMTFRAPTEIYNKEFETIKKVASTFQFNRTADLERQVDAAQQ